MNETEFYKGYKKALSDIKEKLESKNYSKEDVEKLLSSVGEQKKADLKPKIYFTKLDKKGNLEFDREKTAYYAAHPEELENLNFENNKIPEGVKPTKVPVLVRVSEGTADYAKILDDLGIQRKTVEMCKAENALIYQNLQELDANARGVKDPYYLNAIGQQLVFLSQNPTTFKALGNVMGIDPNTETGMTEILNELVKTKDLLQFEEALQRK